MNVRQNFGFVYATAGESYTALAQRSARSLRLVMPEAQIDLFTDQPLSDPVFNEIHQLENSWFRPKMEAIRRSRFDRMVMLDADTIAVQDLSDLFRSVDSAFLAATLATGRPSHVLAGSQADIPRTFPYLNGGVMVFRKSDEVDQLCEMWSDWMRIRNLPKDQPPLRRILYECGLPFQVLPPEYNIIYLKLLDIWGPVMGRPYLLHVRQLHEKPPGDPFRPYNIAKILGRKRYGTLIALLNDDIP